MFMEAPPRDWAPAMSNGCWLSSGCEGVGPGAHFPGQGDKGEVFVRGARYCSEMPGPRLRSWPLVPDHGQPGRRLRRAENKSLSIRDTVPREPISLLHSCSSEPNAPPAFSKGIGKEWVAYILCEPNTEGDGMGFLKPSCSRSVPGQTFWRRLPASYLILWRITFWGPPQRPSFTYEHVVWQITVPPLLYSRLYRTSTWDWSPVSEILGTLRWLPVGIP